MAAKVALFLLRIAIAALFIYAGVLKAFDTQQFALDVQHFELIPSPDEVLLVALYLPWLEICAGLALLARRLTLGALLALIFLDLIFLGALGSAWWRDLDITCGCFGPEENATNFPLLMLHDGLLLAALAALVTSEWRRRARTNSSPFAARKDSMQHP